MRHGCQILTFVFLTPWALCLPALLLYQVGRGEDCVWQMVTLHKHVIHSAQEMLNIRVSIIVYPYRNLQQPWPLFSDRAPSVPHKPKSRVTTPSTSLKPTLVQRSLVSPVLGDRLVRRVPVVRLAPLGDGHHGGLGPDVDGGGPVQAEDAAALYRDDVAGLWMLVR